MMKRTVWTLVAGIAVYAVPSAAPAQGPGAANSGQGRPGLAPGKGDIGANGRAGEPRSAEPLPPPVAGFPDREKRRDELGAWTSILHVIPHVGLPSGAANSEPVWEPHAARVIPPEAAVPASKFRFPTTRFSPAVGEGATALVRGISRWRGGGILAGIGGALAALFGGIFGRKKES